MTEILVKTYTRHKDSKSDLCMKDWTAGDVLIRPDGYYTQNKYSGSKLFGVVLLLDGKMPLDYAGKTLFDPSLKAQDDYSKILGRTQKIIQLENWLTAQQLQDVYDHDKLVAPITIKQSYLDVLVDRSLRTKIDPLDVHASFASGTIDVGPNGHSDANDFQEFESNIINLTGNLTGDADEAFEETNQITVTGFNIGSGQTLTFKASGNGKHSAYPDTAGSPANYRQRTSGSGHAWTINISDGNTGKIKFEGLDLRSSSTNTSDEIFRMSDEADMTVDSCIAGFNSRNSQQDIIYWTNSGDTHSLELKNSMFYSAYRAVVDAYRFSNGSVVDINSCICWDIGSSEDRSGFVGGDGSISGLTIQAFNSLFGMNVGNAYVFDNKSGGWTLTVDRCKSDIGTGNWEQGTSETITDSDDNVTFADTTGSSAVILEDITTSPFDLRLQDHANNIAKDDHSDGSGAGLTMPSIDILGTSRAAAYECGAFTIAAAGTTETETLSLDAMIQDTFSNQTEIDAFLQISETETISLDALLSLVKTGVISLDALLQITGTESLSLDSLIQQIKTGTLDLDAFLQVIANSDLDLDALLQTGGSSDILLDALLQVINNSDLDLDALLQIAYLSTLDLDAFLQEVKTGTIDLDALIQKLQSAGIDLDAILIGSETSDINLDALLQATKTASFNLDAILISERFSTFEIDAFLQEIKTNTINLDALIQKLQNIGVSLDAIISGGQEILISLDSLLQDAKLITLDFDALIQQSKLVTLDFDALIQQIITGSTSLDAIISGGFSANILLDAYLKQLGLTETLDLDALIQAIYNNSLSLDAFLYIIGVSFISFDALVRATIEGNLSLDALIQVSQNLTVSLDALLQATYLGTLSLDAIITLGLLINVNLDALIQLTKSGTISLDAILGSFIIVPREVLKVPDRIKTLKVPDRIKIIQT